VVTVTIEASVVCGVVEKRSYIVVIVGEGIQVYVTALTLHPIIPPTNVFIFVDDDVRCGGQHVDAGAGILVGCIGSTARVAPRSDYVVIKDVEIDVLSLDVYTTVLQGEPLRSIKSIFYCVASRRCNGAAARDDLGVAFGGLCVGNPGGYHKQNDQRHGCSKTTLRDLHIFLLIVVSYAGVFPRKISLLSHLSNLNVDLQYPTVCKGR
jgi:hypothetical protein